MKIQFDANQAFQLDAVSAIVDLFDGQPVGPPEFSVIRLSEPNTLLAGQDRTERGIGNRLLLAEEKLRANARSVQARNNIEAPDEPLEAWELFDTPANQQRRCPHFSVEMETGTGKTYVYLRTIFELSRRYGFQKFVIVVPSVAIREGVLKNIDITADHFRAIFDNRPFEHFVYDAKKVNRLRQFAMSDTLQIQVINIDAFRKNFTGTEDDQRSNVMYKDRDALGGRPIEFVEAARPIVIIDEPQSVDSTEKAQEAVRALNPLCTLRYSATHRNPYNLVYRLDPVRAFELKLVKRIVVANATAEGTANQPLVRVERVDNRRGIKAKLRIHVQTKDGPREKSVTVKQGADLFTLSEERAHYAHGYSVTEIYAEPGAEFVRFSNGTILRPGDEIGGLRDDIWRTQIRHTIQRHLEKEIQVRDRGIKVLSLFFIDRVANYRDYDASGKVPGKFALAFETELADFAKDSRYADLEWLKLPMSVLHDGYFAQDKKGSFKDTRGDTLADDDVYDKIMKNKEQLLSLEEPLRFIFSHSALREGWDNPNVFQICTLNETHSATKKRQEIGRGLRLPVDQSGLRVFDESINRLYIMANESYEDFASGLQTEYEEDCGMTFGKVPLARLEKITRIVDDGEEPIGRDAARAIFEALVTTEIIDADGRIQPAFQPQLPDFKLNLPEELRPLTSAVIDVLASYQLERHVSRARDQRTNALKKEVVASPEFVALWDRIKPRTTYRVEFDTQLLVSNAARAIKRMERIERPRIRVSAGQMQVGKGGVAARAVSVSDEEAMIRPSGLPDVLAYLQNETELTRSTLVRILMESGRLAEIFQDPQRFMDGVAAVLKHELRALLVDGIKYERLPVGSLGREWEMVLFENEEIVDYLAAQQVSKSVYDLVPYDSEVEREFAKRLDEREDIQLFIKLPRGFRIDTPLGKYIPDWAIVKRDKQAIYLVRETKGTHDFMKLRTDEANKVRCGQKHFDAIGVPFAVVVSADEV